MKTYTREDIAEKLHRGIVRVNFTKKDGEVRDMKCTLVSTHIPEANLPKNEGTAKVNESVLRAFDVDAKGWRSFVVANVNEVQEL